MVELKVFWKIFDKIVFSIPALPIEVEAVHKDGGTTIRGFIFTVEAVSALWTVLYMEPF